MIKGSSWSAVDEKQLLENVEHYGAGNWNYIAENLNAKTPNGNFKFHFYNVVNTGYKGLKRAVNIFHLFTIPKSLFKGISKEVLQKVSILSYVIYRVANKFRPPSPRLN